MPPIILALLAPSVVIPVGLCGGVTAWLAWRIWSADCGDSYKRHKGKSL